MTRQTILITGATSGIGRVVATELAARGYRVFGTGRKPEQAGIAGVEFLPLDVTSDESVRACVDKLIAQAGSIDVLINNAGAMLFGAAEETSLDELRAQLDLNLLGAVRMVTAVLPRMRAQGSGTIINISSLGGVLGLPYLSAYTASKFALEGYSEALRLELLPLGIYVTLVEPGGVRTESLERSMRRVSSEHPAYAGATNTMMARRRDAQEHDGMTPAYVARQIAKIVGTRRPRLRYQIGGQAWFLTFARRLLPQSVYEAMVWRAEGIVPGGIQ
jgi:short-subunit dehydrogenase